MTEQNTELNQGDNPDNAVILVPYIEEDIPLPKNATEALPSMTSEEEVQLRGATIKEISDIMGEEIRPDTENIKQAEDLAKTMIEDPSAKQEYSIYPNETMAYLAGLVGSHNHMIVKDLAELKLYVVNKLVSIVESTDNAKEQIAALRSIGEVDGVDAFKKKTEVVHKMETMEEVEKELLSMLGELKQKALLKGTPQTIEAEIIQDDRANEAEDDDH